jgi:carbamoyl-phosphate synthase large subunit
VELARAACHAVPFMGPINIQCRMRGAVPVIFEINPRCSGGIPLTIRAGADFPSMLVRMALGLKVEPAIGAFRSNLWMSSFESSFFLDGAAIELLPLDRAARIKDVA